MNTRIVNLWSAALGAALLTATAGLAQTSLSVGSVPGYPGATVAVPVTLRQPAGGVVAVQFDIPFRAGRVSAGAPVATTRLVHHTVKSREIAPGVRRTLIYSSSNAPVAGTNGAIVTVPFTVSPAEHVGSGPLTPATVILATANGDVLVPLSVGAGSIFVRPVNLLPNGHVQFFLSSTEGQRYAIQATADFLNWVNISTNTATSSFMDLVDIDAASYPYRFYRWELLAP
jgi:hypothetical protein